MEEEEGGKGEGEGERLSGKEKHQVGSRGRQERSEGKIVITKPGHIGTLL